MSRLCWLMVGCGPAVSGLTGQLFTGAAAAAAGSHHVHITVMLCSIARSPWALGLASVLFDVDKGQTLRDLWPPDCLSEEEKAAVAFHAFPVSQGSI